jgi:segregation and condensation protein B
LDYFNLTSLGELPTLAEIRDLDSINRELELKDPGLQQPGLSDQLLPTPTDAEKQTMSEEIPTDLIEADPDGETDSGVVHRLRSSKRPASQPAADSTVDFDPDGETDTISEVSELSQERAKPVDEAD